jgi:hypothetical protein
LPVLPCVLQGADPSNPVAGLDLWLIMPGFNAGDLHDYTQTSHTQAQEEAGAGNARHMPLLPSVCIMLQVSPGPQHMYDLLCFPASVSVGLSSLLLSANEHLALHLCPWCPASKDASSLQFQECLCSNVWL